MPEIEFGRIGKMTEPDGDFTFMVLSEDPNLSFYVNPVASVLILSGDVLWEGRHMRFGDIGPVAVRRGEIEWLE